MRRFTQFLAGRARGFACAFRGLFLLLATQRNARIHAVATVAVVMLGVVVGLSRMEWCLIIFACAGVWCAEALNTAVEFLGDAVTRDRHPLIGKAKDVAAGAVLVTAIAAVIVGVIVFGAHL